MNAPKLILASTSRYRRELLQRFGISFATAAPQCDEAPLPDEHPAATAERLAVAKAYAVLADFPDALIIGSDQVAYRDLTVFGKPMTKAAATAQLLAMSGRSIVFHTGVCLLDGRRGTYQCCGVPTEVQFRHLSGEEIDRYLEREADALHCAGSAKSEGLGIALLDAMSGEDPTALIGLPLIALGRMLRDAGVAVP